MTVFLERLQELAEEAGLSFDDLSTARQETWPLVSLSGASVDFEAPKQLGSGLATSQILLEDSALGGGWFSVPKGQGLWAMPPLTGALEAVVSVEAWVVAFIRLNQPPEDGVQHLLVGQGAWHDLCTFDYDDLGDAVSVLKALSPTDSPRGVSFALPNGISIMREKMVVSLDPFVVTISDRTSADLPPWPGTKGHHAEFFTVGGEDPNGVLALSEDAVGYISPIDPDDHSPLQAFEQELVDQVRVSWRR
jgi:hypothetical protein